MRLLALAIALAAASACGGKTPAQPTPLPCSYAVSASSLSFSSEGGSASITVTAPAACQWTAASEHGWLTITSGASGTGSGIVEIAVGANPTTTERTGALTIAGQAVVVRVDAQKPVPEPPEPPPPPPPPPPPTPTCEYAVSPVEIPACMAVPFELTTTIATVAGCSWTAEPAASWITLKTPPAGTGPATVRFTISDNFDAPRLGIVMIRWPTPTAGQNVRVSQAGCRYAVSAQDIAIDAAGAARTFDVLQESDPLECGGPLQDGCVWTAQSNVPWITITTPMPQKGDQRVSFVALPNDSTSARNGTITVKDKSVHVTQAGR